MHNKGHGISSNLEPLDATGGHSMSSPISDMPSLATFILAASAELKHVIFGDSLLTGNDAVSIIMYDTPSQIHGTRDLPVSLFRGIGIFLFAFSVSMALGVEFGLVMSLSSQILVTHHAPFHRILPGRIAYHTMSHPTQRAIKYISGIVTQLSENLCLPRAAASHTPTTWIEVTPYVKFTAINTVAAILTRFAAVFPLPELINHFQWHALDDAARTPRISSTGRTRDTARDRGRRRRGPVIVFVGTTVRILEMLGIWTDEDDASSNSNEARAGVGVGVRRKSPPLPREHGAPKQQTDRKPRPVQRRAILVRALTLNESDSSEVLLVSTVGGRKFYARQMRLASGVGGGNSGGSGAEVPGGGKADGSEIDRGRRGSAGSGSDWRRVETWTGLGASDQSGTG
ncbi:hypothetical protein BJY52DRAFT_1420334 [Lactarius psammicola]|nr:hypothetical protein BJY52DRAFT_1420334 [Lactarius psammicola]